MSKLVFIVVLLAAGLSGVSLACLGEDRIFADAALRDMPADKLATFLVRMSRGGPVERSRTSDGSVLALVRQGAEKDLRAELLLEVLTKYRCAYSVRDTPAYRELLLHLEVGSLASICDVSRLDSLVYVVPESGAVLRAGPGTHFSRLFGMPVNSLLEPKGRDGEWLRVDSRWGTGFVYEPLVAPY